MLQLIISPSLVGHVCFRVYIRIGLNYLVPTVMGMFVLCMPKFFVIWVGLQMNSLLAHGPWRVSSPPLQMDSLLAPYVGYYVLYTLVLLETLAKSKYVFA